MKKNILAAIIISLGGLFCAATAVANTNETLLSRPDVQAFVQQMVTKHHFSAAQLNTWLGQVKIQPTILAAVARPAEKLMWYKYEPIFLTQKRIDEGVAFWRQHAQKLAKAEKQYGVPAEVIVAIIGVETFYGKRTGDYKVLDALVTLGFDYPPRAKFFLSELEEFLLLTREEKWDPTQIKGSYAGAMGNPQFIASSYRRYSVDFNGNGKRDLLSNLDDSIGSVANYFKVHGWDKNSFVVMPAQVTGTDFKDAIASNANPKPEYTWAQLMQKGVRMSPNDVVAQLDDQTMALISLEGKEGPQYWLGGKNFFVITRYNHSNLYAMAVHNLSQKVKQSYQTTIGFKSP